MLWSPQQDRALTSVARWIKSRNQPIYRLWGYAGTSKTTLARHLAEGVNGPFTNQADLVGPNAMLSCSVIRLLRGSWRRYHFGFRASLDLCGCFLAWLANNSPFCHVA